VSAIRESCEQLQFQGTSLTRSSKNDIPSADKISGPDVNKFSINLGKTSVFLTTELWRKASSKLRSKDFGVTHEPQVNPMFSSDFVANILLYPAKCKRAGDQEIRLSSDQRFNYLCSQTFMVDSSWNVMAHGDAREGKWRGNWGMEWVSSTFYTTS
jgi:hypothetical protein